MAAAMQHKMMSSLLLACMTTLQLLLLASCSAEQRASRVAIIGAGMGGSYAAHSLAELSEGAARIDVFEASSVVGGRAHSFELNGTALELGASIIWEENLHLRRAAEKLGLGIVAQGDTDGLAIFDGKRFVAKQASLWDTLSLAMRYGPSPLLYGQHVYKVWEEHFRPIYTMQDEERRFFNTPEDMLQAMGMYNLTQTSSAQHMHDFFQAYWWCWGSGTFINELAGAVNRCNYNQHNAQLNAMAGLVSFLPASGHGGLWSVEGGNSRLAEALLNASGATVHMGTTVLHVQQDDEGRYSLETLRPEADVKEVYGPYDSVIVAAPLESSSVTFQLHTHAGTQGEDQQQQQQQPQQQQQEQDPDKRQGLRASSGACRWLKCVQRSDLGTTDGPSGVDRVKAVDKEAEAVVNLDQADGLNGVAGGDGEELVADADVVILDQANGRNGAAAGDGEELAANADVVILDQGNGLNGAAGGDGEELEADADSVGVHRQLRMEKEAAASMQADLQDRVLESSSAGVGPPGQTAGGRQYQRTITTFVSGQLQPSFFGVTQLPSQRIFVTDDADMPFTSIGPRSVGGRVVYKLFSTEPLHPTKGGVLERLFGPDVKVLASRSWEAYPAFTPPESFAPFELQQGLCYVNTIESAASAMEMAAIGGKNCALMAHAQAQQQGEHLDRRAQGAGAGATSSSSNKHKQSCPDSDTCDV